MKERPILFSAPMVRAILAGTKTQTRRIIKPDWWRCLDPEDAEDRWHAATQSPYGVPGDRLWVRETFKDFKNSGETLYRADFPSLEMTSNWTPSIYMPRWASRITLEVTEVRVQRLHEISEEDAKADGVSPPPDDDDREDPREVGYPLASDVAHHEATTHRRWFADLWRSINGAESWDLDPWVWAISFKRVTP